MDRTAVPGRVVHPARNPERGHVVLLPGFLDPTARPATVALADELAGRGLTTTRLEPRGSWEPGARPADHTVTAHLDDVRRLVDVLPPGRIAVVGHCYGGHVAALAAAADPRITDVAALMPSRTFIWPDDYDSTRDTWRGSGERAFLREDPYRGGWREFRLPYAVVADARTHDLPRALGRLRQRALFVAGEQDEVIGVAPVRRLHDECGSTDRTLAVLPVQHDFAERPHETALVHRTVAEWLD